MAIKGKGYTKTSWSFEERPVPSAKLNTWDDRIELALELVHNLLSLAWGGGDGVIRKATTGDLAVVETPSPSLTAQVSPGYAFIARYPFRLDAPYNLPAITPPALLPRIDLVVARLENWDASVVTGTEASSPVAPNTPAGSLALARLFLRPGMTSIKNVNDGINGYIVDVRTYL
ncbi:MAG: hypothetical protein K1Y02_22120 [Candidatus Hydrogenedentes bacterium]|nr:hypothetical protein [Candidatus Hydrogenedentota bacterium]